jgi:hypothetical protein
MIETGGIKPSLETSYNTSRKCARRLGWTVVARRLQGSPGPLEGVSLAQPITPSSNRALQTSPVPGNATCAEIPLKNDSCELACHRHFLTLAGRVWNHLFSDMVPATAWTTPDRGGYV